MKKKVMFFLTSMLVLILSHAQQQVLASWYFDALQAAPNTSKVIPAEGGAQVGNATIYLDGTNGSSDWVCASSNTELTAYSGSTANDNRPSPNAGQALALVSNTANGKSFVYTFSTTNMKDIKISFAYRATSTGFSTHAIAYSLDGSSFTSVGTFTITRDASWHVDSIDLSSITAINNQPLVYLRITVSGATSTTGNNRLDNILIKGTSTLVPVDTLPPIALNAWIVNPSTVKVSFNEALSDTSATNTTHYQGIGTINAITLSTNKDTVTLALATPIPNATHDTLYVSGIRDTSGNVMTTTYWFDLYFDTLSIDTVPPIALNAWLVNPSTVKVSFNEALSDTSAVNPIHYQGLGSINSIVLSPTKDTTTLSLAMPIPNGTLDTLFVSGIYDQALVQMTNTYSFVLYYDTLPAQIVITEIMYNPPESGIDSLEFIEFYNNGPQTVNMKGFNLRYGTTNYTFPNDLYLASGGFLLVAPKANNASHFYGKPFYQGPTGGISNSGTTIKLYDAHGNFVDSVKFTSTSPWPTQANGQGYSLSLCNPNVDNNNPANWGLGTRPFGIINGYTVYADPGELCSMVDTTPPIPINAWAQNLSTVKVAYNEPVDPTTATDASNYTGLGTINNITLNAAKDTATVSLAAPLQNATMYTLTINHIKDLNNNQMTHPAVFTIYLDTNNTVPAIVITEIMYNPPESGTDSLEFIEFYNNGGGIVNLRNFVIRYGATSHTISQDYFLQPGQFFLYAPNAAAASHFYGMTFYQGATTGISNSGTTIKIFDAQGNLLDSVKYLPSSPWPIQANGGGYSLSLCNPNVDNNDPANWGLGTIAYGIVNNKTVYADPGQFCVPPADTIPPVPTSAQIVNATTIQVTFNEAVEATSATTTANYTGVGSISNITLDASQTVVTLTLVAPLTPGVLYNLTVANVADIALNVMTQPVTFPLIYDTSTTARKLVITEIMYNPPESGTDSLEFIEIYNNDNVSVDLLNYTVKYGSVQYTFTTSHTIAPQNFVILAPNKSAVDHFYNVNSIQISTSGLSNSGTFIALKDAQNRLVDSVYYMPTSPWPTQANGQGYSLTLCDPNSDNTLPSNWYVSGHWVGSVNGYAVFADPNSLCILTSMEENQQPLLLYPNPTSEFVTIVSPTEFSIIQLYNIIGKQIYQEQLSAPQKQYTLSLHTLPAGMYFLTVQTQQSSIKTPLIVK